MLPCLHTHPRTVTSFGAITVLDADRVRLAFIKHWRTNAQFLSRSRGLLPPIYRSSANLATYPRAIRSPSTWFNISSSAVSEPGIPMAHRVYTLVPLKGEAVPQYFRDSGLRGI